MAKRKRDPFAGVVKAASAYPAWRALTKHEPAFFLSEKELRAACARMLRAELKRAAERAGAHIYQQHVPAADKWRIDSRDLRAIHDRIRAAVMDWRQK